MATYPPHISEDFGRRSVSAGTVVMLLVLGAFLATVGPFQAAVLQGQAITDVTPTQSYVPTTSVAGGPVTGLAANVAFVQEDTEAPRRCAPAGLPPQCLKPESHALRRTSRMMDHQTALDSLSSKEKRGDLGTTGPFSEKPGERNGVNAPDNSLSCMSSAQASLSTQRTTVLRL